MRGSVISRLAAVLLALTAMGCSSGYDSPTSPGGNTGGNSGSAISISGFAFAPANLTVAKGTTVQWTNKDNTDHTVTGDDGKFGSAHLGQNGTFSQTFNTAGTFTYHCAIHPTMTAKVTVQ